MNLKPNIEPNVEPHPNLMEKFEHESNLNLAEPEPCDLANRVSPCGFFRGQFDQKY